ncbi:unnamed protein product [Caenorhabditis bovis]|uniref:Serpentine Receptor, class T n=1 Tax=Caenorhabditis bovis TaxID=2654633 RepID=A0A8S1FAS7_9PELO|nr:unnamed protein product [Caenorhabditis bovis]
MLGELFIEYWRSHMFYETAHLMQNDYNCSLNYLFRNNFELDHQFYSCDHIVDSYAIGMRRPILGIYFILVGAIVVIIYVPCLIVIAGSSDLMRSSCYKIMMLLGILDIFCICTNSLATGFLGYVGATFCSYPRFIFVMGAVGCGCWMGTCATCIILAINRCCDINHNLKIRAIFKDRNIYLVLAIPIIYTIYSVFFTKPLLFDSNYMSWFFYPGTGLDLNYYRNIAHTVNNCVVSVTTTSIYAYLCLLIRHKSRHSQSDALSKTQKQVFVQSILICSFNAIAAYIYVYMQFFYSPPLLILIGQIAWQYSHGSVCIVYITMNRTIRRKVINLLVPRIIRNRIRIGTFESSLRTTVSFIGGPNKITATSGSSNF